jgi:hypothetical protein
MSYSNYEKTIAKTLSFLPFIKQPIKWFYQLLNYYSSKKDYLCKCKHPILNFNNANLESFFGYYDKSPENETGKYIIFQQSLRKTNKKPSSKIPVQIVLKNIENEKEQIIGKSYSYNWHQGTKLQWLSEETFIYNFYDKTAHNYKSRIYNATENREEAIINSPVYDCFKTEYALSVNFSRLAKLRPDYGYRNVNETIDLQYNKNDGIFYTDLKNNTHKLLISLQQLIDISALSSMKNAKHKVNHIMISPDGDKFIFLHRWFIKGGKRFDRLLVANKKGENIRILADEGMVSHCCWYGNDTVIGFLRQPLYNDSFYKIDVNTLDVQLLSRKLLGLGDGHPSVCNDLMAFDSYPDRSRMKKLFIYNLKNDTLDEIGEFFEPMKYFGETRCDLHPKWNYDGSKIFIDSVHEGKRNFYEINLNK